MPILRFHHVKQSDLESVASDLLSQLGELMNLPIDHINLEIIHSTVITADGVGDGYPIIEILAFERPAEVEAKMAKIIYDTFSRQGYEDVEVFFMPLTPKNYYCSGVALG